MNNGLEEHVCSHEDMHPYNCLPLACCHCNLTKNNEHDPETCVFCVMDKEDGLRPTIDKILNDEKIRISL